MGVYICQVYIILSIYLVIFYYWLKCLPGIPWLYIIHKRNGKGEDFIHMRDINFNEDLIIYLNKIKDSNVLDDMQIGSLFRRASKCSHVSQTFVSSSFDSVKLFDRANKCICSFILKGRNIKLLSYVD